MDWRNSSKSSGFTCPIIIYFFVCIFIIGFRNKSSNLFSYFGTHLVIGVVSIFFKQNLFLIYMGDLKKRWKCYPSQNKYDSLGYSNTVIHSIWCVWGNISTGCTWENLNHSLTNPSTSLAIVIGLQEIYKSLNWYSFFRFPR